MKTLYESILDDEDILMSNAKRDIIARSIYEKLINCETLERTELNWMNNNVSVLVINRPQLLELIQCLLEINCNISLNWLDVSKITDMSSIFSNSNFNGDISKWNVSKVKDMSNMFSNSNFNRDISKWNVSKVKDIQWMFEECSIKEEYKPKFNK